MPAPRLSDEILQEAVELRSKHKTTSEAARAAGIPRPTFTKRLKCAAERGLVEHDIEMEIPEGQVLKGVSTLVDGEGNTVLQWVKTKADTARTIDAIKAAFDGYQGRAELIPNSQIYFVEELLSVYPIADQHNGLLAWGRETGENYDLAIGIDRLRTCMNRLVLQSPPSKMAVILNLGDWQHTDNQYNVTPASGNVLDVDSRYFKILTAGVQLMMDCIELALQKHDHVLVRNIPGNHDPHASIALTVALSAFYMNNPRVTVSDDPSEFFFHRFGQTLIGATHGHRMKPDRMAMAMAVMRRKDWGETRYHWFLHGHYHSQSAHEIGDVRVEGFQTLAANDAWGASKGFTSGKSLTSVTIHAEDGEIGRHRVNVPRP